MAITFYPDGTVTGGTIKSPGNIIQVKKSADYTDQNNYNSGQESAGPEVTITPLVSNSLIYLSGFITVGELSGDLHIFLYRGSTKIGLGNAVGSATRSITGGSIGRGEWDVQGTPIVYIDTPGAGTHTYKITAKSTNGNFAINKQVNANQNQANDNSCISYIVAMEVNV